jgi:hypothetical protein
MRVASGKRRAGEREEESAARTHGSAFDSDPMARGYVPH